MRGVRGFGLLVFAAMFVGALACAQRVAEIDSDRDGLSDIQEQALLEKFLPRFQVNRTDCALKPALFAEGLVKPTVVERDGTIY